MDFPVSSEFNVPTFYSLLIVIRNSLESGNNSKVNKQKQKTKELPNPVGCKL